MTIHKLKLLEKKSVSQNTLVLIFEKPEGFNFIPGQYAGFTLMNHVDPAPPLTRRFSLLSTPKDQTIAIATRLQDTPYKNALKDLPLGAEIKFAGPSGNFILHPDHHRPAVFIAGGIGITPFYSMLKHAINKNSQQTFYLFYGNQTLADSAFINELLVFEKQLANLKLIFTLAEPPADWQGESGFITTDIIQKYIPDLTQPIYYVCGSKAMVNALHHTLQELEIAEENIRIEDFPGY